MIKKLLLFLILSIPFSNIHAQESKDYEKVKFGKVESADFAVKPFGKDSAASAIILFDIGYLHFGIDKFGQWVYILERHKRLKILNKEGYHYANFEIPIYSGSNAKEQLNKVQMASYNLINGKVEQNKAAKDEKFQDKFNKNYTNYKYTVSNIQEGTIVEIKYEIQSDIIYTLRDWYFQKEIPIIWNEFTFNLPEYFNYKPNYQFTHPVVLEKNVPITENFSGTVSGASASERSENFSFQCESNSKKWVSKNIPAFKDEAFITTDEDYISKISFEILSTKFPGSFYKSYSSTWEQVMESYKSAEKFGEFIKPNGYSKKIIATIVKDDDKGIEKGLKIFNYVKSNIKWNNKNGDYATETSTKNVIENKLGNVGDINLTLLNLLKSANLDVKPIILSTRSNGRHPGYPSSSQFNYVIVKLDCDSVSYLLDATNINNTFNIVSMPALNHEGLLVDLEKTNGKWISLDPQDFSSSSVVNTLTFDKELKLKGASIFRNTNYEALSTRKHYQDFSNEADYLKDYKSNKNGLNILKYTQSEFNNPASSTTEIIEFELEDYIEEAGSLIYFNPLLYQRTKENPFKEETRNFPIDFAYPRLENYRLIITVPEGFVLDKLPESINFKLQNNTASFTYTSAQSNNQILISSKISISASQFGAESYNDLKELFKQIVAKQAQPLVFKKL